MIYQWNNTLIIDRDLYFVSRINHKAEITHSLAKQCVHLKEHEMNALTKGRMLCKFFYCFFFALALIILAGDVEGNQGFQTVVDIKTTTI